MRVMVSCGHQPNRPLSSGTRIRPIVATPPPAMSCMKQLMAGGGIIVLGTTLIPLLSTLF